VFRIDVVKDYSNQGAACVNNSLFDALQHGARKAPMLNNHDRYIAFACEHRAVAYAEDWRGIEERQIVFPLYLFD